MIQAVSLDLDDTLWPIAPVIQRAESELHDWLRRRCPEVVRRHSVSSLRELRVRLAEEFPDRANDFSAMRRMTLERALESEPDGASLVEEAYAVFLASRNRVQFYDDALPVLQLLSAQVRLASISNGNADLEVIGIHHYFEHSVRASDVGTSKPDPDIFHHVLQRLELEPAQVMHVGDSLEHDVEGARAVGMRPVWLCRDDSAGLTNEGVERIRTLSELPGLLRGQPCADRATVGPR